MLFLKDFFEVLGEAFGIMFQPARELLEYVYGRLFDGYLPTPTDILLLCAVLLFAVAWCFMLFGLLARIVRGVFDFFYNYLCPGWLRDKIEARRQEQIRREIIKLARSHHLHVLHGGPDAAQVLMRRNKRPEK